ncbi:RWP-RK domain-containing protein [Pontibacter korlensis]|uniref:Uncharacterized protein n=1 Tax=Pontibacter korlensis TaxID=400092 RepID=A0A0E3UXI8_9BACT|nr:hypothetical protein PKOR_15910 [Pontibacter korlensis]
MESVTLTRQALYEMVWAFPMRTLSQRYHISDVGLRKACLKRNIPLQKPGYWLKTKRSKPVPLPPVPASFKGKESVTLEVRRADAAPTFPAKPAPGSRLNTQFLWME